MKKQKMVEISLIGKKKENMALFIPNEQFEFVGELNFQNLN